MVDLRSAYVDLDGINAGLAVKPDQFRLLKDVVEGSWTSRTTVFDILSMETLDEVIGATCGQQTTVMTDWYLSRNASPQ